MSTGDIPAISSGGEEGTTRLMHVSHQLVETVWTSALPVVAAVSGVVCGGGFSLALACDLVVCSADTRSCQVFVRRRVIPDLGGAHLLPRLVQSALLRSEPVQRGFSDFRARRAGRAGQAGR